VRDWDELERQCRECTRCALSAGRTNCVFGTGSREAKLMFVGEAPGAKEDETGIPFVGAAGKLLDKYLCAVGISREDVYIANILKCRPPANRDPLPEEQDACIEYLREQVRLIRPKVIVCLGRIAACYMIDKNFKVTKEHGQWVQKDGIWMMGTFHPAALLRNPNNKPLCFEDMLGLQRKILEVCPETYDGIELLGLPQMPK